MNLQIPKKAAVINSFAGYGRCSLTEALPILSAMRVQACPVPTAVFSNHTGFAAFACQDLTAFLPSYLEQWKQLNLTFDGVLCGFLGQAEQILSVSSFLSDQKSRGCQTILVDPVMGDHGKPYRTITPKHCQKLRSLIPLADIITPNITEACLLTDTPWKDGFWNESELSELCQRLHKLGPSKIVITGLPCLIHGKEGFENYLSCREPFSQRACLTPSAGPSRHGTGDIFASILMADALNGVDFSVSVQKAEENDVGIKGGMTVECSHDDCIQCGVCVKACREGALSMEDGRIVIDRDKCNNCARCVKSCPTDAWKGTPGYIVSFGGLFGNHIYKGEQLVPIIRDKETLFRVTDAAISFFEKHANGGERFRLTLQRVGEEEFKKEIQAAYEGK